MDQNCCSPKDITGKYILHLSLQKKNEETERAVKQEMLKQYSLLPSMEKTMLK